MKKKGIQKYYGEDDRDEYDETIRRYGHGGQYVSYNKSPNSRAASSYRNTHNPQQQYPGNYEGNET